MRAPLPPTWMWAVAFMLALTAWNMMQMRMFGKVYPALSMAFWAVSLVINEMRAR